MGTEIELKLATSKRALHQAMALPWLASAEKRKQELTSVYFDTEDFALRKHGVSLRVRRVGERRLQTVKTNSGALIIRGEWETEIDRDLPNLDLTEGTPLAPLLRSKLTKQRLQPIFETIVERVAIPLHIHGSDIELSFDHGCVATVHAKLNVAEIELELKKGDPAEVARIARKLAHSIPVALSVRAKAELGYALLDGALDSPAFAEPVAMTRQAKAADALVTIGFACLRQIAGNEGAVRQGDPEGIHQMRVGLRRLRAALSLFKEMLLDRDVNRLKRELKWLTEQLGPARDTDVFVSETLAAYRDEHASRHGFGLLVHDLERTRSDHFRTAGTAAEGERFRRLLLDCALWLLNGGWRNSADDLTKALRERPARAFAQHELARRIRKIGKQARKLDRLDSRKRHKLRVSVKKVRYGREFFETLRLDGRKPNRKLDRALKKLQNGLGNLNDMQVHLARARSFAMAGPAAEKAFAIGRIIGREEISARHVVAEALAAGKRLRKAG